MIHPEISDLFDSLAPIHQVLCLELIKEMNAAHSTKGEETNLTLETFFAEIIVSYLSGKLLQFKPSEIDKLKAKADRLGYTRVNIARPI